jgi:hypothetical protein
MRKLASIQVISKLEPIPNSDNIEVATILGWTLVVKKGEFKVNDKCIYFEIDSLLPDKTWSKFMESRGFKVKTIKLRGQISQGLALPISNFPELKGYRLYDGRDLTSVLGITKIGAKPQKKVSPLYNFFRRILFNVSRQFFKTGKSNQFPTHLFPKTDETRIQSSPGFITENIGRKFYTTEKLDGCSVSLYTHNKEYGICSRNFQLDEATKYSENDTRYKIINFFMADSNKRYQKFLKTYKNICIQGELIGEKIQGNKYSLKENDFYIYHIFDTVKKQTLPIKDALVIANELGFKWVPIINYFEMNNTHTIKHFVDISSEKSLLNKKQEREGIVVRTIDGTKVSFKAISPKFLLKFEEDSLDDE